jgi:HK97 family phage major capsid protein
MLVEPLQAASVILGSGATVFNSSAPLRIPTIGAAADLSWVGENEEIPEATGATFGEIELMPTSRKSIKTIVRVSNELIRMASTGVSAVLQRRIIADVRDKLDTALLVGDGTDDTVTGLLSQSDLTAMPYDVADPDTLLDALAALAADEVTATKFIMNGADFFALRKLKDADGRGLLQADLSGDAVYRLHGVPVIVTNKLPAGKAIAADMSAVAVVRDEDAQITLDKSRYLEFDQTAIRVTTRYDLGIIRPEAVIVLDSAVEA